MMHRVGDIVKKNVLTFKSILKHFYTFFGASTLGLNY